MIIYIPQNLDPYNTHLKNLAEAYLAKGFKILTGFEYFFSDKSIPDIIHFHFLEAILKYIDYDDNIFFTRLDLFKKSGVVFLYTVHDARPHSDIKKINYQRFFQRFNEYVDLFIHHGNSSVSIFKNLYPNLSTKKHIVCPHGDYLNDMKSFNESVSNARKRFGLPANKRIILIFGQLQYKNTFFAVEVFRMVRKKYKDTILLMAGVSPIFKYNKINKIYYFFNNLILNKFRLNKVIIHKRFSQFETYLLFKASDIIFLPHNSGLTTGIIPMSATLCKPFVYPDIGNFEEQALYCFAEKFECGNANDACDAIYRIITSGKTTFDNSKWLADNNWKKHVEEIVQTLPEVGHKN